jgi:hypothetical protein
MIHEVEERPRKLGPTTAYMMAQYSPNWWRLRCGIPTASAADRILTPTGKVSAQAKKYVAELIADRCCLSPNFFSDRPQTRDMANGTNMEPEARRWYAMERPNSRIQQVGFCVSEDGRFGCSPDGLVDEDGVVELKCPKLSTQVEYLQEGILPPEYVPQCNMHLIVTGRKYVEFVSYAPGLPGFIVKLEPNDFTAKLRVALEDFHNLYQETIKKIAPHLLEQHASKDTGF